MRRLLLLPHDAVVPLIEPNHLCRAGFLKCQTSAVTSAWLQDNCKDTSRRRDLDQVRKHPSPPAKAAFGGVKGLPGGANLTLGPLAGIRTNLEQPDQWNVQLVRQSKHLILHETRPCMPLEPPVRRWRAWQVLRSHRAGPSIPFPPIALAILRCFSPF